MKLGLLKEKIALATLSGVTDDWEVFANVMPNPFADETEPLNKVRLRFSEFNGTGKGETSIIVAVDDKIETARLA